METGRTDVNVVLITKTFPFNILKAPAENYLINEIKYLSKIFNSIYVIAADANQNDKLSVELPDNVKPINVAEKKILKKTKIFLFSSKHFLARKTLENQSLGLCKRIRYAFFRGKSDYYYNSIYKRFIEKAYIKDERHILLYTFWFYTYTLSAIMIKKNHYCKAQIISRAHGYDLYSERNSSNYIPLREYMLSQVDYIYPCSYNGRDYLIDRYPNYSDKISTAYLGSEDHGIKNATRSDVFTIVSCSRVEPVKRLGLLAEALLWIQNYGNKKIRWIHIGDGSKFNSLKQRSRDLIENDMAVFYGAIDNDKIFNIYKSEKIDLFVNVSESEGLPISMMEASSIGFPILATDVGGVREIVSESNGWLVSPTIDSTQLAKKIIEISELSYVELFAKGNASRQKWEESFCIKNNLLHIFRGLLHEEKNCNVKAVDDDT